MRKAAQSGAEQGTRLLALHLPRSVVEQVDGRDKKCGEGGATAVHFQLFLLLFRRRWSSGLALPCTALHPGWRQDRRQWRLPAAWPSVRLTELQCKSCKSTASNPLLCFSTHLLLTTSEVHPVQTRPLLLPRYSKAAHYFIRKNSFLLF